MLYFSSARLMPVNSGIGNGGSGGVDRNTTKGMMISLVSRRQYEMKALTLEIESQFAEWIDDGVREINGMEKMLSGSLNCLTFRHR
jgi:hypothetical protein